MRIRVTIWLLALTASSNVWATGDIFHRIRACTEKLTATLVAEFSLSGKPMAVPAREKKADMVTYPAQGHPGRLSDRPGVHYVAELEKMLPPILDSQVAKFLRQPHAYLMVTQYPSATDRLHVDTLIYSKEMGRPSRMIYSTTDFIFEVLEKYVVVNMKNLNSTKSNQRSNHAYWILAQNTDKFPYAIAANAVYYFPIEHFPEFIATIQSMGWDFF